MLAVLFAEIIPDLRATPTWVHRIYVCNDVGGLIPRRCVDRSLFVDIWLAHKRGDVATFMSSTSPVSPLAAAICASLSASGGSKRQSVEHTHRGDIWHVRRKTRWRQRRQSTGRDRMGKASIKRHRLDVTKGRAEWAIIHDLIFDPFGRLSLAPGFVHTFVSPNAQMEELGSDFSVLHAETTGRRSVWRSSRHGLQCDRSRCATTPIHGPTKWYLRY